MGMDPIISCPSTPVSQHTKYSSPAFYRPLNPSPLASPRTPQRPSPVAARRSQYKSRTPTTPIASSSSRNFAIARAVSGTTRSLFTARSTPTPTEDPQKAFLREKFKARCFERAAKAREKAIRGRRYASSEASSDGFDDEAMDEDDEEDDDDIMQDELFRRIMENANRKVRHSYRVSYAHDVGSSFDPDMEDISNWEQELLEAPPLPPSISLNPSFAVAELTPEDLDDEELAAYAEECVKRAAIADFEDIPEEDLFSWSDVEDLNDMDMDI